MCPSARQVATSRSRSRSRSGRARPGAPIKRGTDKLTFVTVCSIVRNLFSRILRGPRWGAPRRRPAKSLVRQFIKKKTTILLMIFEGCWQILCFPPLEGDRGPPSSFASCENKFVNVLLASKLQASNSCAEAGAIPPKERVVQAPPRPHPLHQSSISNQSIYHRFSTSGRDNPVLANKVK